MERPIADRTSLAAASGRTLACIATLLLGVACALPALGADGEPVRVGIGNRVAHTLLAFALEGEADTFELVPLDRDEDIGADPIGAIAAGSLDLLATTAEALLEADAGGIALRGALLLATSLDGDALLVDAARARERLQRGGRIAVSSGSAGRLLLSATLQRRGLSIAEFDVIELTPADAQRRWLDTADQANRLDALVLAEPALHAVVAAADAGGRPVAVLASAGDSNGLLTDLIAGEERWLNSNRDALATLIRAWDRTVGELRRGQSSARREALAQRFGIPVDALLQVLGTLQPLSVNDNIEQLRGDYQKAFSSMSEVLARRDRIGGRGVPSANRFLSLGSLRRIAAGR